MAEFYERMQGTADRLLKSKAQGTVSLKRITTAAPDPSTPWIPGSETVTTYALNATVKRLHQRYESGVLVVETGDMVTFAVPAVTPVLSDKLVIDGTERVMTNLTPVPAAGTPVMFKAWCAA